MRSPDPVVDQLIDQAETVVLAARVAEGFGILTEIDVPATFETKLGVTVPLDWRPPGQVHARGV
jgi:hypothetical protein